MLIITVPDRVTRRHRADILPQSCCVFVGNTGRFNRWFHSFGFATLLISPSGHPDRLRGFDEL